MDGTESVKSLTPIPTPIPVKAGDGVRPVIDGNEVEVVDMRVSGDADAAFLAMRFEEGEEVLAIGAAREDSLTVVAALDEMEASIRRGEAIFCKPRLVWVPPSISGFRRGKI